MPKQCRHTNNNNGGSHRRLFLSFLGLLCVLYILRRGNSSHPSYLTVSTTTAESKAAKVGNNNKDNTIGMDDNISHTETHLAIPEETFQDLRKFLNRTADAHSNNNIQQQKELTKKFLKLVPKPRGKDVELFNTAAWQQLRGRLGFVEDDRKHTLLVSIGGSITSGGGSIPKLKRWDRVFADMVQANKTARSATNNNIEVINRGHGSRTSMHFAHMVHSFLPAGGDHDVDIIIWEFALNDLSKWESCQNLQNVLIALLDQIARHNNPTSSSRSPPLVILAYYWDKPDRSSSEREFRIGQTTFECHDRIAASYDFVVGTVNLASYLNRILPDMASFEQNFLADTVHPNVLGHWLLAFLLWDLAANNERQVSLAAANQGLRQEHQSSRTLRPSFNCSVIGSSPIAEKRINDIKNNQFSFASWTADYPQNTEDRDGMLYASYSSTTMQSLPNGGSGNNKNVTFTMMGKASDVRQDRQFGLELPCCGSGQRVSFFISDRTTTSKRRIITAAQIYAPAVNKNVKMRYSHDKTASSGVMVDFIDFQGFTRFSTRAASAKERAKWSVISDCYPSGNEPASNGWVLLPNQTQDVTRIDFCNANCEKKEILLVHVALF